MGPRAGPHPPDQPTQPGAQLTTVSPHTDTETPQGIVEQSGRTQATQLPAVQVSPAGQSPHWRVPPQPSGAVPQVFPWQAVVLDWGAQQTLERQTSVFGH